MTIRQFAQQLQLGERGPKLVAAVAQLGLRGDVRHDFLWQFSFKLFDEYVAAKSASVWPSTASKTGVSCTDSASSVL